MDKYQRLAQKLQNREKVLGFTIQLLNNPLFIPTVNREDLDFVLFDAEHGIFDAQNAAQVFQVCRLLGLPALYRVQDSYYHLIAKAIDIGADGVMIPRTETLEQLRTAVDALLFYPDGRKGFGGHGQSRPGERFEDFGKTRFLFPQIESPKGIEMLPKMLEEYGRYISAVVIGPYDLSIMLGTPKDIRSPAMVEAVQKIFDICAAYGKSCGTFCDDAALAQVYRDMGCNFLWTGTDTSIFQKGYQAEMDALAKIL